MTPTRDDAPGPTPEALVKTVSSKRKNTSDDLERRRARRDADQLVVHVRLVLEELEACRMPLDVAAATLDVPSSKLVDLVILSGIAA